MNTETTEDAVRTAIRILGGQRAAGLCMGGVTQGAVSQYIKNGVPVAPVNRVLCLERAVIEAIGSDEASRRGLTRESFRPDVYPRDERENLSAKSR